MKTIRVLRQERGWTQFALALKVGVQPQAIDHWESDHRTAHRPRADRRPGEPAPGHPVDAPRRLGTRPPRQR